MQGTSFLLGPVMEDFFPVGGDPSLWVCNWQSSVWELPLLAFHFKWFPFINVHKLSDTKTVNKEQRIEQTFLQQKYTDGWWAHKKRSTLLVTESHSVLSDSLRPHGLYSPWNSPGQNTGVGSLSLLQGILPTQGSNPGLPHCRRILHQLSHQGSPRIQEWGAYH